MGTIVVGGILLVIVALIIRSMIKDKKAGKSFQCGGDCGHCKGHCE
ncbi:MAG: FeoB-associated Cys-rich membrane protein [Lachnospiraceae bacterium]|nr:FeoB-associated Cys-rich membrane protein [Lachnospiraceae bacterium]